jgi:hypothetical protein
MVIQENNLPQILYWESLFAPVPEAVFSDIYHPTISPCPNSWGRIFRSIIPSSLSHFQFLKVRDMTGHLFYNMLHCKKWWSIFPSPAGMSLTKLCPAGKNNNSWPGRVWLVTSRLGTGKSITFLQCMALNRLPTVCAKSLLEIPPHAGWEAKG